MGVQVAPEVVLAANDQHSYKRFQKMKPPLFQGGKGEDAHEFMILCHEMLEVMGLADPLGVHFVALQFRGTSME